MKEKLPMELPEDNLRNPYLHTLLTPPSLNYNRLFPVNVRIIPTSYRIEDQPPEFWPI